HPPACNRGRRAGHVAGLGRLGGMLHGELAPQACRPWVEPRRSAGHPPPAPRLGKRSHSTSFRGTSVRFIIVLNGILVLATPRPDASKARPLGRRKEAHGALEEGLCRRDRRRGPGDPVLGHRAAYAL